MDWTKHGSLVAAALYVAVAGTLLAGQEPEIPVAVVNGLQLRPLVTLARTVPPPDADGTRGEWEDLAGLVRAGLAELAHRPFADPRDRLRGAAAAAGVGSRHLVPVLAGPLAATDPAAAALTAWAFEPGRAATPEDLAALRALDLPTPLADMAVAAVAGEAGPSPDADAARQAWARSSEHARAVDSTLLLAALGALVAGALLWRSLRRLQREEAPLLRPRPTADTLLPPLRVVVYFAALFVTTGMLGPDLLAALGLAPTVPQTATILYGVNALGGLALVLRAGQGQPPLPPARLLGWSTLAPARVPAGLAWGVGGWCLLLVSVFSASVVSAFLLGLGGDPFDNPVSLLLVLDPDPASRWLLVGTAVLAAPLFEETLFRGFLHARLRRHFSPFGAAALSGLLFAAAHLSLSNLLPLWALGFTLGVLYDRAGTLWAPVVAHGLWNLGTAAALLAVFA